MPHDKAGTLVNVGDLVNVKFKVTDVNAGEEYCNATLETVEPMYPSDKPTMLVINTKQCAVEPVAS